MSKHKTVKQCKTCPWRKDADPYAIPNGYCPTKHERLRNTIAQPGAILTAPATLRLMACHMSESGAEFPCAGWLEHQLGPGNNVSLRMAYAMRKDLPVPETDGEQHACFEDTLPK